MEQHSLADVLTDGKDGFGLSRGQVTGMMLRLSHGHIQRSHSGANLARPDRGFLEERKHNSVLQSLEGLDCLMRAFNGALGHRRVGLQLL